jgi:CRP-like cAMP-binding protein
MKNFQLIQDCFLFRGIDEGELRELLYDRESETRSYRRGELIYSCESGKRLLGLVISGECEVVRNRQDGGPIVLNTLGRSDSFGILSVISDNPPPTAVYASRSCEILFFDDEQIRRFIETSPKVSKNLISFLADRIAFLNRRIATFSGNRVEDRLAAYLIAQSRSVGSRSFSFSHGRCAEQINAGRASVYRAVAALEAEGLISVANKTVSITDPEGLERMIEI